MKNTQSAIFAEEQQQYFYYHLEFSLNGEISSAALKAVIQNFNFTIDSVNTLIAFSSKSLSLLGMDIPAQLKDFPNYHGVQDLTMPSTQGDILVWLKSDNQSLLMDQMLAIVGAMKNIGSLDIEVNGFNYHNSRDMIGFVDGTGNPKTDELRYQAAVIPQNEIGAGGSYVMTQKWVTDLAAFNQHPVKEQEQIIGRTKVDDIELEGDEQPNDSHVSRTDIKIDGVAQKIWRSSSPYASATEQGLYFLAFSCELTRFESQIHSMLGLSDDGVHDRLMEFSKPVSGSYWFAPSQTQLKTIQK